MRIVVLLLALVLAADVARAEDYPECAQYNNDFAYNACLARHGPTGYLGRPAHEVDLGRPSHEGHAVVPRRSGRMHLELPVGPLD